MSRSVESIAPSVVFTPISECIAGVVENGEKGIDGSGAADDFELHYRAHYRAHFSANDLLRLLIRRGIFRIRPPIVGAAVCDQLVTLKTCCTTQRTDSALARRRDRSNAGRGYQGSRATSASPDFEAALI
jgi:hypothetical protein